MNPTSPDSGIDLSENLNDMRDRLVRLERRNRRMGLMLEVLTYLQSAGSLETTLRIVLNCVTSGYAIGFNRAFLFLLDEDGKRLKGTLAVGPRNVEEAHEIWKEIEEKTQSLEDIVAVSRMEGREGDRELTKLVTEIEIDVGGPESFLDRCLSKGETVVVGEKDEAGQCDIFRKLGAGSFVCAPISSLGRPIGLVIADNLITGDLPTDEQVGLLKALAHQVGQAIASARHYEDVERRYQELSTLNEVGKGILSTTDLETDLGLIARISAQVLNARGGVLRLLDDDTGALSIKAMYGVSIGEVDAASRAGAQDIAEAVASRGEPILVNDAEVYAGGEGTLGGRKNLVCVPLAKGDRVVGTLTVFDRISTESLGSEGFGNDDVRFLAVLGSQAAIAIENAKLFDYLRNSQDRIRELHKLLLRSERLAALGELSSQVAHEIRNPLTAIGGFARSIERKMAQDDPDREHVEIIIKETDRLERILTEQLAFAKLSPPEFTAGDINQVIKESISLLSEKIAAKSARLEVGLQSDIDDVRMDPDKMKQVLINLIQNAADNLDEGGSLKITSKSKGRMAEVRVANDGPPIPESMLERIFVPFATTKAGGSGLGLPIAYEIIYEHGGTIDVKSEFGSDTVFLITLPLIVDGERRQGPVDRRSMMRDRRRRGRTP
ncbi:GAF domain-containing protein [Candidatus Eisenbacteria bacterium]|uniref:histidine kinase n=1 Tax=Eiseniibacteriota bacterium TaxID=2212470 RepID=A0ABV6YPK3_UNCEI